VEASKEQRAIIAATTSCASVAQARRVSRDAQPSTFGAMLFLGTSISVSPPHQRPPAPALRGRLWLLAAE
jgi:hypothetical protein